MGTDKWVMLVAGLGLTPAVAVVLLAAFGVVPWEAVAGVIFLLSFIGLIFGFFKLSSGPFSRLIARWPISLRWKIVAALTAIGGLVFFSTLVNFQAMDYMHQELHEIQDLGQSRPGLVLRAVDDLERTQHGPLFDLTPLIAFAGAIVALGLGIGIARSAMDAMRSIERGMERIAAGDLSEPIQVPNRDEFGALAARINDAASDLAEVQEATLMTERARGLRERIVQVTMAQEEERRRISRELHDDLGPSLAAIVNRLRAAGPVVRTAPGRVEKDLDEITEELGERIRGIRKLIYDLRPLALDQIGLVSALRQHLERFEEEHGVRTSFSSTGRFHVHPLAEVTVFRVVQEALSNIQAHADARHVDLNLRPADGCLEVTVEDDGHGFDATIGPVGRAGNGIGMLSMRERAELVDGTISIMSSPGGGCRVTLRVPLEEVEDGVHPNSAGR